MSDDELLDSEESKFIDAADVINNNENLHRSGETIAYTIDQAALSAFENFDIDDFETKLYPVKKQVKEKKTNPFIQGTSKFLEVKDVEDEYDLEDQVRQVQENWHKTTLRGSRLVDMQTTDVVKIDKKLKKEFIKNLGNNIDSIKDFLINETAPTELAVMNAFEQSKQTLDTILGIKLEGSSKQLRSMISDAIILKTFSFIAHKLGLEDSHKETIINKYFVLTIPKTTRRVK